MKIYKRFSPSSSPIHAFLDGKGCWLSHKPSPAVMQTASFHAVLRAGVSAHLIRSLELGWSDQYYTFVHRGIGERDLINLYSREEEARVAFEGALRTYEHDSCWQKA